MSKSHLKINLHVNITYELPTYTNIYKVTNSASSHAPNAQRKSTSYFGST